MSRVHSPESARRYVHLVAQGLGFVERNGSSVALTSPGIEFARTASRPLLAKQLVERVAGVREILALLEDGPLRIGVIHAKLADSGFLWESDWQVRYRLRWLETAELVVRRDHEGENKTQQRYPEYVLIRV